MMKTFGGIAAAIAWTATKSLQTTDVNIHIPSSLDEHKHLIRSMKEKCLAINKDETVNKLV